MERIYHNCCGLDIHKDSIVACILKSSADNGNQRNYSDVFKETRLFETFPEGLKELRTWLESEDCRHIAMESTGVYWYPVYETLEEAFDGDINLLVVNARHMHNVPGKKTDIKDAEWIADLLSAGLLSGSFVPPREVRELRQLTRYRKNIVEDICTQKNRIEKTLQQSGFKLSSFLTDVFGVSGRNLMNVLIKNGHLTANDVETETKCISKVKKAGIKRAISGNLRMHDRQFLEMQLHLLDELLSHLLKVEKSIDSYIAKASTIFSESIELVDTIPGIAKTAATAIIAEIGTDMDRFESAERLCSWAGLVPGSNISAGKKKAHASCKETHI